MDKKFWLSLTAALVALVGALVAIGLYVREHGCPICGGKDEDDFDFDFDDYDCGCDDCADCGEYCGECAVPRGRARRADLHRTGARCHRGIG